MKVWIKVWTPREALKFFPILAALFFSAARFFDAAKLHREVTP
ncbi:MAG TPA: hypothetical protein PLQ34_10225 [Ferrovaceae bacterium]|nr:hypothetical protein [Ferrovaceae bacterium]